MGEPNLYEAPAAELPSKGRNPTLWVILWLVVSLVNAVICTPGQDPFGVIATAVMLAPYGILSFSLGLLFAQSKPGGKSASR